VATTRRHFFFGSLLAGAVAAGGFGSTASLKMLGVMRAAVECLPVERNLLLDQIVP
jgi:hypothetical protein